MTNPAKEHPALGVRGLVSDPRKTRLVASGLVALAAIAAGGVSAEYMVQSGSTPELEKLITIASLQLKRIVSPPGEPVPRLGPGAMGRRDVGEPASASSGSPPKLASRRGPVDPLSIGEPPWAAIQDFWSGSAYGFTDGKLSSDDQSPDELSKHFGTFGLSQRAGASNALTLAELPSSWTGINAYGGFDRPVQTAASKLPTPSNAPAESTHRPTEASPNNAGQPAGPEPGPGNAGQPAGPEPGPGNAGQPAGPGEPPVAGSPTGTQPPPKGAGSEAFPDIIKNAGGEQETPVVGAPEDNDPVELPPLQIVEAGTTPMPGLDDELTIVDEKTSDEGQARTRGRTRATRVLQLFPHRGPFSCLHWGSSCSVASRRVERHFRWRSAQSPGRLGILSDTSRTQGSLPCVCSHSR